MIYASPADVPIINGFVFSDTESLNRKASHFSTFVFAALLASNPGFDFAFALGLGAGSDAFTASESAAAVDTLAEETAFAFAGGAALVSLAFEASL